MVHGYVFHDAQVRKHGKVLIDHLYAVPYGVDGPEPAHGLALDADAARVRLVDPGDDLDQRGLAAAVLSGKAVHLAVVERQVNVLEGLDAAEGLADALQRKEGVCHGSTSFPARTCGPFIVRRAGTCRRNE